MELLQWLQLLNDLDLNQSQLSVNVNNIIFIGYTLVYFFTKRATALVAFFMCVMLVDNTYLKSINETYMYLMVIVIYSYVFETCLTRPVKCCCGIIILITTTFATDAALYGADGFYGATETVIYNNIEYISLFVHSLFIGSFISIERIRDSFRRFIGSFMRLTASSDYMLVYWYNISKIQQIK